MDACDSIAACKAVALNALKMEVARTRQILAQHAEQITEVKLKHWVSKR